MQRKLGKRLLTRKKHILFVKVDILFQKYSSGRENFGIFFLTVCQNNFGNKIPLKTYHFGVS